MSREGTGLVDTHRKRHVDRESHPIFRHTPGVSLDIVVLRLALCVSVYSYPLKLLFSVDKNSNTAGLFIVVSIL